MSIFETRCYVKMNHQTKNVSQRSFRSEVIVKTHMHTYTQRTDCSKVVGNDVACTDNVAWNSSISSGVADAVKCRIANTTGDTGDRTSPPVTCRQTLSRASAPRSGLRLGPERCLGECS